MSAVHLRTFAAANLSAAVRGSGGLSGIRKVVAELRVELYVEAPGGSGASVFSEGERTRVAALRTSICGCQSARCEDQQATAPLEGRARATGLLARNDRFNAAAARS